MGKAYHLYPDDCEIYRAWCEILPAVNQLNELRPVVEEMLKQFPEHWSVWATAGRVLVELQELEWGCRVSEEGTKLQPQLAELEKLPIWGGKTSKECGKKNTTITSNSKLFTT